MKSEELEKRLEPVQPKRKQAVWFDVSQFRAAVARQLVEEKREDQERSKRGVRVTVQ